MHEPLGLTSEQVQEIEDKLRLGLQKKANWKVDVFGSRRRGDFKTYSDLDLWIETHPALSDLEMATLREIFEESELPIKVDLVTPETVFEDYRPNIVHEKINWLRSK